MIKIKSIYDNYQNRFIRLADLEIKNLPEKLEFDGDSFVVKPEFHITLISVEKAAKTIDSSQVEELKLDIVREFYKFVENFPLNEYELSKELRLVNVNGNKTVVAMAKLTGIEKLFAAVSEKYGVKLPVQPTHATLYTLPRDTFGIAINSYEELDRISKPIEIPEMQSLI